jgi:hypothetical protein
MLPLLTGIAVLLFACKGEIRLPAGREERLNPVGLWQEQIVERIKEMYRWRISTETDREWPFQFHPSDSVCSGLEEGSFRAQMESYRKSGFFTESFLENYQRMARCLEQKTTTGQLRMRISDPEPFSQGTPWFASVFLPTDNPVEEMVFRFDAITQDHASLGWIWGFYTHARSRPYNMEVIRQNGVWKINYMEGFDPRFLWDTGPGSPFRPGELCLPALPPP